MKVTYVSCFCTNEIPSGNPAVVVEEFAGDDHDKQKLATKLNFPVTVFVEKMGSKFLLRFFYPLREMPLCIHGSLSAAYVLMEQQGLAYLHALTKSNQELLFKKSKDVVQLEISQGEVLPIPFLRNDLNKMLGVECRNVLNKNLPNCISTIGSPKLLVPLVSYPILAEIEPNFSFIKQWSIDNNINGLYVYTDDTRDEKVDFIARGFNPKGGDNEDAATGVAVGALYTALKYSDNKEIRVKQGEFIKKPSYILASSNQGKLFIGGKIRIDSAPLCMTQNSHH